MVGDETAVPLEAVFLDALLRFVIHVGQAEALAVAEREALLAGEE